MVSTRTPWRNCSAPTSWRSCSETVLGYGQTNGSIELRQRIAALYPGQGIDNVLVTNGSSEANFVACHTLLEPGDEVVVMIPNYMQIWGIAEELGATPIAFHLREENDWAPDLDELREVVTDRTRMIAVCNPNNPTGYTLTPSEMQEIVAIAESVGAWIYADEVYRGAELDGIELTSFVGMADRVMVSGGLSKAYALPGLRLGWLVGPAETVGTSWAYHDYTSITAGILSHEGRCHRPVPGGAAPHSRAQSVDVGGQSRADPGLGTVLWRPVPLRAAQGRGDGVHAL